METKRKYLCFVLFWTFSLGLMPGSVVLANQEYDPNFWLKDWEETQTQSDTKIGVASWYGGRFHGRRTASGEAFDKFAHTCASRTLPFGTLLRVTHLKNGKTVLVRVNDRGPFRKNRVLDLSYGVARKLGLLKKGVGKVEYTVVSLP